jgi:ABC-type transport system involved in multi-copper enzyme maturation permease subunit
MFRQIKVIAKYTFIEAMLNRLFWVLAAFLISAFAVTEFIADIAVTDQREIQIAILANLLRYSGIGLLTILIISSGTREQQDKSLDFMLSLPISRTCYFLGKLSGFITLSLLISTVFALLLFLYADLTAVILWSMSYCLELIIICCLSLLATYSFRHVLAGLGSVLLFYILARALGAITLIAQGPLVQTQGVGQQFIDAFFSLLSWMLPALDRFSQTSWLVYGDYNQQSLANMLIQALIYIPLLSAVALVDFYRKNISR